MVDNEIATSIQTLDSWFDASKDFLIVLFGFIAGYYTIVHLSTSIILSDIIIVGVSALASLFLPYKIANTKQGIYGLYSRARAIVHLVYVGVSWIFTSIVVMLITNINQYFQITGYYGFFLSLALAPPFLNALIDRPSKYHPDRGLMLWILARLEINEDLMKNLEEDPWMTPLLVHVSLLWLVPSSVYKLWLVTQIGSVTEFPFPELPVPLYTDAFLTLLIAVFIICISTYYEPSRYGDNGVVLLLVPYAMQAVLPWGDQGVLFYIDKGISIVVLLYFLRYASKMPKPDMSTARKQYKILNNSIVFEFSWRYYTAVCLAAIYMIIYYYLGIVLPASMLEILSNSLNLGFILVAIWLVYLPRRRALGEFRQKQFQK